MASQIKHRNILDGYVLIFRNFKVLKHLTKFWLPVNVNIEKVASTYCRGSTTFGRGNVLIKVKLGNHLDHPLEVIVSGFPHETETFGDHMPKLYSDIRGCFISAINYGVSILGCWQRQCCQTYESVIKNRPCGCNKRRYIDACVATQFGIFFMKKFELELFKRYKSWQNLRVNMVIRRLGQNISRKNIELSLSGYKLELVDELLVHLARDYWVQGNILLWNTVLLRKEYGQKPYMEYYPGLLRGHGNLYYVWEAKNELIDVKEWKFYSQLFKEVHNVEDSKGIAPFTKQLVKKALRGGCDRDKDAIMNWITCLRNVLRSYENRNAIASNFVGPSGAMREANDYIYCREEIIFGTLRPDTASLEMIANNFANLLGKRNNMSIYFDLVEKCVFLRYLHSFLDSLLDNIEQHVNSMISFDLANKLYLISDGKYF